MHNRVRDELPQRPRQHGGVQHAEVVQLPVSARAEGWKALSRYSVLSRLFERRSMLCSAPFWGPAVSMFISRVVFEGVFLPIDGRVHLEPFKVNGRAPRLQ